MDHLHTAVRQQAMRTLAQMSKAGMLLEGKRKSLLEACFRKVFLLPPDAAGQCQDSFLYFGTLDAMDILLESLVLSSPGHRLLKRILQMLLPFTDTKHAAVCERAVARIVKLAELMARYPSVQIWSLLGHDDSSSHHGTINNCFLGQLLGHLIVCRSSKVWEIQQEALLALHHLCRYIQQQKCMTSPEDDPELPQGGGKTEAGKYSCICLCSTRDTAKAFEEYLHPADKTFILLRAIEAMKDSHACDEEELISIVNVAEEEPASWLTEVPVITRCIYKNLQHISAASARHSLNLLLISMAKQYPREMILSLTDISAACDSGAQAMWEVLLSHPLILVEVLRELNSNLQHLQLCWPFRFHRVEACIRLLVLLVSSDVTPEEFARRYHVQKSQLHPRLFSPMLQSLVTLSQSSDRVSRAQSSEAVLASWGWAGGNAVA
ncbi:maestro heat-like repeat-containing protein family member 7 isoform 1-T1 [Ara ararauna]